MNKYLAFQSILAILFIVGLSRCATYIPVIRDTGTYEEFGKSDVMKMNLQPGDEIKLIADGTIYKKYMVVLLRPDEITVVKTNPKFNENNYFSFLYENIDSLDLKVPPLDDKIGISITLALIVFYLLI